MRREGRQRFGKPTNHSKSSVKGCKGNTKLRSIEEESADPEFLMPTGKFGSGKAKGTTKLRSIEGSDPELVTCGAGASATRSAAYLDGEGSYDDHDEYEGEIDDYEIDYDSDTTFDEYEGELSIVSEKPGGDEGYCKSCWEREMHKSMKMMNGACLDRKCNSLITEKVLTQPSTTFDEYEGELGIVSEEPIRVEGYCDAGLCWAEGDAQECEDDEWCLA